MLCWINCLVMKSLFRSCSTKRKEKIPNISFRIWYARLLIWLWAERDLFTRFYSRNMFRASRRIANIVFFVEREASGKTTEESFLMLLAIIRRIIWKRKIDIFLFIYLWLIFKALFCDWFLNTRFILGKKKKVAKGIASPDQANRSLRYKDAADSSC